MLKSLRLIWSIWGKLSKILFCEILMDKNSNIPTKISSMIFSNKFFVWSKVSLKLFQLCFLGKIGIVVALGFWQCTPLPKNKAPRGKGPKFLLWSLFSKSYEYDIFLYLKKITFGWWGLSRAPSFSILVQQSKRIIVIGWYFSYWGWFLLGWWLILFPKKYKPSQDLSNAT